MAEYLRLHALVEICGDGPALRLVSAHGGTRIYVPGKLTDDHELVRIMGFEAATALVAQFSKEGTGGVEIELPMGPTGMFNQYRRQLADAVATGGTEHDIARRIGVCGRTVRREKERQGRQIPDPNQGDLF